MTPENGGKWGTVEGTRDVMNWAQADAAYALAKANGFPFKWHTLVWGNQQPAWIESLPPAEQLEEIEEWYAAIAARYPDIDQIEVVNEPLHDPPRGATNGNYIEALGGDGVTRLGLDHHVVPAGAAVFPECRADAQRLQHHQRRQCHDHLPAIINAAEGARADRRASATRRMPSRPPKRRRCPTISNNLNRLAATGLPIYITELDIDGVLAGRGQPRGAARELPAHLPGVLGASGGQGRDHLGLRAGFHWRNAQGDWLLYPNGGERPALQWLIRYVQNAPAVVGPQTLTVNESAAGGTPVGAVLATDADAGTTFSQWQIASDPSGKFVIDAATGVVSLAAGASLDFETATSHTISVIGVGRLRAQRRRAP